MEEIRKRKLTQLVLVKLGAGMGKYSVRIDDDLLKVKGNFTASLQLLMQLHFVLHLNYDTECLGAYRILSIVMVMRPSLDVYLSVVAEILSQLFKD